MTWKLVEIWSSTYRLNIHVESTWIRRGVPVGYNQRNNKHFYYYPPSEIDLYYFGNLDELFFTYNNHDLYLGEFKMKISQPRLQFFLYKYELNNRLKEKMCFRNINNPIFMGLILRNNAMETTLILLGLIGRFAIGNRKFKSCTQRR